MEYAKYEEAAAYIKSKISVSPRIGMVLGSGLGVLGEEIEDAVKIPYNEIPHFPVSTVEGHAGQLVIGTLNNQKVLAMQGRFHFYEGYSMDQVTLPIRVMKLLGIETILVTNAAGGVNTSFRPGDLMLISDHIKFFSVGPLWGPNAKEFGPRFHDMSTAYTPELREAAREAAKEVNIHVQEGVYAFMAGPNFETPAEIRMLRTLGADAVGMSTVPEVIVAAHAGMKVLGITSVSNMAAGILNQPLNHEEVIETGEMVREKFLSLVKAILPKM